MLLSNPSDVSDDILVSRWNWKYAIEQNRANFVIAGLVDNSDIIVYSMRGGSRHELKVSCEFLAPLGLTVAAPSLWTIERPAEWTYILRHISTNILEIYC